MVRVLAALIVIILSSSPALAQEVVDGGVVGGFTQIGPFGPTRDNVPPATGRSTIRGRVVAADNGQPIRRASVRISAPELRGQRTALTDAEGRYEFAKLPAGRYTIHATKNVYVAWSFGQTQPGSPARPMLLADDQVADNVNISLPRASVITGRVTDELGEPLPGISISLMQQRYQQGQQRLMPFVVGNGVFLATNDIGEYRLYGLPPGQYYVTAQPQQQQEFQFGPNSQTEGAEARNGYARTFYPGTADVSRAQKVAVGISQTLTEINFMLLPTRLATISGMAVDLQGQPLGRGFVMVVPRGGMMPGGGGGGQLREDGTFTVPNLAPGTYTLRAAVQRNGADVGPVGPPQFSVGVVTIDGQDVTDVRLTPMVPVTVSGRVSFDDPAAAQSLRPSTIRVMAQLLNPDDNGIGFPGGGGPPPALQEDFSFELKSVPGRIGLRASIPPVPGVQGAQGAQTPWLVKAVRVNGTDVTDSGIEIDSRGASGIEIELTNRRQEISGSVTDAGGDRVKDYVILMFAQDRTRWTAPFNRYLFRTQAGDDGLYKANGLPPGDYYAIALDHADPLGWQDPEFLENLVRQASTVSLEAGETQTLDLKLFTTP